MVGTDHRHRIATEVHPEEEALQWECITANEEVHRVAIVVDTEEDEVAVASMIAVVAVAADTIDTVMTEEVEVEIDGSARVLADHRISMIGEVVEEEVEVGAEAGEGRQALPS